MTSEEYWKLRFLGEQMRRTSELAERGIADAERPFVAHAKSLGLDPLQVISFNDETCTAVNQAATPNSPAILPAPVPIRRQR